MDGCCGASVGDVIVFAAVARDQGYQHQDRCRHSPVQRWSCGLNWWRCEACLLKGGVDERRSVVGRCRKRGSRTNAEEEDPMCGGGGESQLEEEADSFVVSSRCI